MSGCEDKERGHWFSQALGAKNCKTNLISAECLGNGCLTEPQFPGAMPFLRHVCHMNTKPGATALSPIHCNSLGKSLFWVSASIRQVITELSSGADRLWVPWFLFGLEESFPLHSSFHRVSVACSLHLFCLLQFQSALVLTVADTYPIGYLSNEWA